MLKRIVIVLILITWPLSLFIKNTFPDFVSYVFPFFQPKLIILPLIFLVFYFHKNKLLTTTLLGFLIFLFLWKPFFGQTIFIKDYEKEQLVLQKSNLYPTIPLARLFQNKARIPLDKLTSNFFALTDLNNYFFGFAPRQITIDNQNLRKFPFLSLPFLFVGLFYLRNNKYWKIIIISLIACIINLSLLTNFDRNDFILWLPISTVIIHGINVFEKKIGNKANLYFLFVIFFAVPEIMRIIIAR